MLKMNCVVSVRLSIFIHANILVPVSEFIMVAIFSEWWLWPTTVGTSLFEGFNLRMLNAIFECFISLHNVAS